MRFSQPGTDQGMSPAAATALGIALKCVSPTLAPIAAGIALHENHTLNHYAINHNSNGTTDYGLAQINSSNFVWLTKSLGVPVNERTIFDPCINLQAALQVLFVRYNGNPPDEVKVAYATGAIAQITQFPTPAVPDAPTDQADPQPPAWDIEAVADWRRRHAPTAEDAADNEAATAIAEPINHKEPTNNEPK